MTHILFRSPFLLFFHFYSVFNSSSTLHRTLSSANHCQTLVPHRPIDSSHIRLYSSKTMHSVPYQPRTSVSSPTIAHIYCTLFPTSFLIVRLPMCLFLVVPRLSYLISRFPPTLVFHFWLVYLEPRGCHSLIISPLSVYRFLYGFRHCTVHYTHHGHLHIPFKHHVSWVPSFLPVLQVNGQN